MQQTRIEQGAPFYLRFVARFPTVSALAGAGEDEVMRYWQGLGYYTRARNLHKAAKVIEHDLRGVIPDTYEGLLALPGIGPYSAAAIASFAYGLPYPVVDGNVKRVVARFAGITASIDLPATHDVIRDLARKYMKGASPGEFNQAIMNLGALVCKPKGALCGACPISKKCHAFQHNTVGLLPVRTKTKSNTLRYFHFIVLHHKGKVLLLRRNGNDIWRGLFTPPMMERRSDRAPLQSRMSLYIEDLIGHQKFEYIASSSPIVQQLSHQTLHGRFHHFRLRAAPKVLPDDYVWVSAITYDAYGKPKMVRDYPLFL